MYQNVLVGRYSEKLTLQMYLIRDNKDGRIVIGMFFAANKIKFCDRQNSLDFLGKFFSFKAPFY